MIVKSEHKCFGGVQGFYEHESRIGTMRFGLFLPPKTPAPALYFLPGLSCTEETFAIKAGAQRVAAQLGLALVSCDASTRLRVPGDDEHWDFGLGASFYLDATQAPWATAYRMYTYIVEELPSLIEANFPVGERGIFGHSMGGHGALALALRNPDRYRSVSAFAPITSPTRVPWGQKAFARFLGENPGAWAEHDTVELLRTRRFPGTIYVDQGTGDRYLQTQLLPDLLEAACAEAGQPLQLNRREGYDHSYYFVASFVEDHLRHHAAQLLR